MVDAAAVSFADGSVDERRVFAPHERVRSMILPQLDVTPADMLSEV